MTACDHCAKPFSATRPGHRFCSGRCRSAWHHAQNLPGTITGIRALKRGGWAITIHVPEIEYGIELGTAVHLETTPIPRQNASSDHDTQQSIHGYQPSPETATSKE